MFGILFGYSTLSGREGARAKIEDTNAFFGRSDNLFFFFTLVTGPRRSLNLKLSDTRVYAPQIRARLATTAHFCKAVALELTAVPKKQPCASLLTQIRRGGVTLGTDEDTTAFSENHLAVSFQQSNSISFFGE